ncbi:MAG TPA: Gmad2 immunoglobulin-like domain-containing protein [Candidatus Limnocylindrales bacterium]|nr:Gmad2 immunoglobulin-like domain-containing protein [Candidatus Limnocylindrales bacterium]
MSPLVRILDGTARALAVVALVAACGPSSGVIGPVGTPPPSTEPSVVQSEDPTPPPSPAGSIDPSGGPSTSPSGPPASSPGGSVAPSSPSASPAGTTVVRAYLTLADGLVPVLRSVPATKGVARAAINALLAGPSSSDGASVGTAVPSGVSLLGISISGETASVDLSSAFASGGSTASQVSRVAQVVYTLTQFGNVTSVKLQVAGTALPVPDDRGTIRTDAVSRADYREQLPEIFVDRPAWHASIGNPARITGVTRVFEATFRVRLVDAAGNTLADRQVMASCGSGCWGAFDVTLGYAVRAPQWGTLRMYNPSARDGSPEDVRDEPVWLTPAG